jgi:hypothetical protein
VLGITVYPNLNLGPFNNIAIAKGVSPFLVDITDKSTNGNDVDPDNDGPENDSISTPVSFQEYPMIGLAKNIDTIINNHDGTYTVTYNFKIENTGDVPIHDLSLIDSLSITFADAINFSVISLTSSRFTVNPNYNGTTTVEMLNNGNSIEVDSSGNIQLIVLVKPGSTLGIYSNTANVNGTTPGGNTVSDRSTDGKNTDTDNDGNPGNNNEKTSLTFQEIPSLGIAKSMTGFTDNGDGSYNVSYTIKVQNTGDVILYNLSLEDNLAETFSNASAFHVDSISSNDFNVNNSFDGLSTTALLSGSDSLMSVSYTHLRAHETG